MLALKKDPSHGGEDFACWSDVVVYIKSDSAGSVMEREQRPVWLTSKTETGQCCMNTLVVLLQNKVHMLLDATLA